MSPTDVVLAAFDAYRTQDRAIAERLLAEDFRFTSPQDNRIDKRAFLERCFPTADRFTSQEIVRLVPVDEDSVFLLYEYELTTGGRYRNVEHSAVRNAQLHETQVFFGGQLH